MKRGAALERRTPMERGPGPQATQWGTRAKKPKPSWRDQYMPERMAAPPAKYTAFELAWFAFVRTLECRGAHLGRCRGHIEAAHVALSADQKGTGMKVPHTQTVPLCRRCHAAWDGRLGRSENPFAGLSRDERYALAAEWVDDVHALSTPEDREQALAFEQLGIGRIVGDGTTTGFAWLPGPWSEIDEAVLAAAVQGASA